MGNRPLARSVRALGSIVTFALWCSGSSCARSDTAAGSGTATAQRRDVVLITIDTLRADRVGVTGGPAGVTPALDALGRSGTVFLDATAHAPLTLPSHTSILTGRYPPSHGVYDNGGFRLGDDVPTLAELLHTAGFRTAAFVSSFVLRASTGLSRGFDVYDDRVEGLGRAHQTASALQRRAPEVAREAARWLKDAPRPFFLWVHFYDPHTPYDPPPAFAAKFPGRPYEGEVAAADFGVSMVLDAIPAARRGDTLVVVTGDHGESLGEHGESEHGILLYDATLHVPLIVEGPGVAAGVAVARQVRHVDLLPTIAELIGVSAPSSIDGVSLVSLLRAPAGTSDGPPASPPAFPGNAQATPRQFPGNAQTIPRQFPRVSETTPRQLTGGPGSASDAPPSYAESRFGELHFGWQPLRSLRDGEWKYIEGGTPELYHLPQDRAERADVAGSRRETAAGMAHALGALTRASAPAAAADPAVAERLRSLGYVTGRVEIGGAGGAGGAGRAGGEGDPKHDILRYEKYVKAFNDALAALEGARSLDAETGFRALAREFPRAFEPHQYLARALAARRATADAVAELDLAIQLSPREAVLYFDAARTLADGGQFDRAFARIAEGRRLEPASYYGALAEGLVARAAGQTDRAERVFREAIQMNPTLAVAHFELGQIAESRGDRAAARREYQLALDGDVTLDVARRALDRLPQ
jgi:choline-sulfatase